jgi:hypothetical protein
VRDLDQQLDQAVHHLTFARAAVEGEQRQTDALRVPAQLPGVLDRCAASEAFNLVGMQAVQQVAWQRERAQDLELADLGQQAFQASPAWVGGETRKRWAFAANEQGFKPPACCRIEPVGHKLQCRVVVRGAHRAQDPVKPIYAGAGDAQAGEPRADLRVQHRRRRFARQQVVCEPTSEARLSRLVEGGDGKVSKDRAAMPAPRAAGPVVAFEHVSIDADLCCQMSDHSRCDVGLLIRKATALTPTRQLRRHAQLAGVGQIGQERQVFG